MIRFIILFLFMYLFFSLCLYQMFLLLKCLIKYQRAFYYFIFEALLYLFVADSK